MAVTQVVQVKDESMNAEIFPFLSVRESLQATIRRYSWQSVAVRLASVAVVAWYFSHLPLGLVNPSIKKATAIFWPVVCLFLLWLWEGHIKSRQSRYCDLYEEASAGKPVQMTFPVPRSFNVSGLWIPTVLLNYLVLIGLCALAAMGL